jgi:phospho-N-acetylmuramoyl-pentapeptide-transferase
MSLDPILQILVLMVLSAVLTVAATPALTAFLYRHRLGKQIRDAKETPIFSALHAKKSGTPTMGGVLVWGSLLVCLGITAVLSKIFPTGFWHGLNFWSRSETYLPIAAFLLAAWVGLVDDFWNVRQRGAHGGGLRARQRLLLYTAIAVLGAWWFYAKLDWTTLHVPFVGNYDIHAWYIPLFVFVIVATSFSVNEADGLDGLAGGMLLAAFTTFGVIAVVQGKFELASFIAVIVGALTAFLWFNIPPARFFMGDTGAMGMGVTLGVIAMLTNTSLLLPVICLPFVIESASVIIQRISKKLHNGKKVFLSSPIHHHLEAKGWPEPKIVMRFWIISALSSVLGLILLLVDKR